MAGEQKGKTHDEVILDRVGLAPRAHDKGIVVSNDDDLVDTSLLEVLDLADEAGDVLVLARRGERSGYGDEDDFLVLELCFWNPLVSIELELVPGW